MNALVVARHRPYVFAARGCLDIICERKTCHFHFSGTIQRNTTREDAWQAGRNVVVTWRWESGGSSVAAGRVVPCGAANGDDQSDQL